MPHSSIRHTAHQTQQQHNICSITTAQHGWSGRCVCVPGADARGRRGACRASEARQENDIVEVIAREIYKSLFSRGCY